MQGNSWAKYYNRPMLCGPCVGQAVADRIIPGLIYKNPLSPDGFMYFLDPTPLSKTDIVGTKILFLLD